MLASASYDAAAWRDFYVMFGAAAATLTGLVFVGLSIHRRAIVASPFLRLRARYLTGGLTGVLVTAAFALVPAQSDRALGGELIASVIVFWTLFYVPVIGLLRSSRADLDTTLLVRIALAAGSTLLWIAAGASLIARHGGGLYLLLPGVIVGTVLNVSGAWSILMGTESD